MYRPLLEDGSAIGCERVLLFVLRLVETLARTKEGGCHFCREPDELLHRPSNVAVTGVDNGHVKSSEAPVRHELDELPFLHEFVNCHRRKLANSHARQKRVYEAGWIIDGQVGLYCYGDPILMIVVYEAPLDLGLAG